MKVYQSKNVFEAALERINWLFDEFPNVVVGVSGGKDSTVVFELCYRVAKERNRLPLEILFLDQEAEYEHTIKYMRTIMTREGVKPRWYQMPFKLFNATSFEDNWLMCWKEGDTWLRDKEPYAVTENIYGTDRFHEMFGAIAKVEYPKQPVVQIAGMRSEENPKRFITLTNRPTYKWATWGKILDKKHNQMTMYPIYDWSYTDVWKAIHENGWDYNKIYDYQYSYGASLNDMRVSNLHHETAVHHLFMLQEIEPKTYEALSKRIKGIDTAGKFGKQDFFVKKLPFMFKDWGEYRDYLLDKLIPEQYKEKFKKRFIADDKLYGDLAHKVHIQSILCNDFELTKIGNWQLTGRPYEIRKELKKAKTDEPR